MFEAIDTDYGVLIGCHRNVDEDNYYWRMSQFVLPFYTMTGPYGKDPLRAFRAWIPIDDENTMVFGATYHPQPPADRGGARQHGQAPRRLQHRHSGLHAS